MSLVKSKTKQPAATNTAPPVGYSTQKSDFRFFATINGGVVNADIFLYQVPENKILKIEQVINTFRNPGWNNTYNHGLVFYNRFGIEIMSFMPEGVGVTSYDDKNYEITNIKLVGGDIIGNRTSVFSASTGAAFAVLGTLETKEI